MQERFPKRLLIVACSASKTKVKHGTAGEIYDGVIHKVINKAMREHYFPCRTDVLVLSAKYGLIRRCDWIDTYEQRMTSARAKELRPQVSYALQSIAAIGYNETRNLVKAGDSLPPKPPKSSDPEPYREIYVELGKDYTEAIAGLLPECFPGVPIQYGEGGIGERQAQLLGWLKQRSDRPIKVGSRVKVLTGTWAGAIGEAVTEDPSTGKLVVSFEEPWDNGSRWEFWDEELQLLDPRPSYRTPGTKQVWRDLKEWWNIAYFHFEAKTDGSHKCNPDTIGAKHHVEELLETPVVEECQSAETLTTVLEFFDSKRYHNNSGFNIPARGHRHQNPIVLLKNRLHNQLQRLRPAANPAELPEKVLPGMRLQGPHRGSWQHGSVAQTHQDGRVISIRFDNGSYGQFTRSELRQAGFARSDRPKNPFVANLPTDHPYPEQYLRLIEQQLLALVAQGEKTEEQQEQLLVKAQAFAEQYSLAIDGSEGYWVFYPKDAKYFDPEKWRSLEQTPGHPYPEFHLGQLVKPLLESVQPQAIVEDLCDRINNFADLYGIVQDDDPDEPYFTHPDRHYCLIPINRNFCAIALPEVPAEQPAVVPAPVIKLSRRRPKGMADPNLVQLSLFA